jgi:hypothetical protein
MEPGSRDNGLVHDDDFDEVREYEAVRELLDRAKPLREMVRNIKPGDRWPHQLPAPNGGPEGGVREPRRPIPSQGSGAAAADPETEPEAP